MMMVVLLYLQQRRALEDASASYTDSDEMVNDTDFLPSISSVAASTTGLGMYAPS